MEKQEQKQETVVKGLPTKVEFNKQDWQEHIEVIHEKEQTINLLQEALRNEEVKFNYLLQALQNTYQVMNNIPEGKYQIAIQNDSLSGDKPMLKFIPID